MRARVRGGKGEGWADYHRETGLQPGPARWWGRGAGGRRLDGAPGRSRLHSRIMEESLLSAIHWLLAVLALPSVGCQPFSRSRWCPRPCCRSVPSRRCSATSSWRRTCSGRPCWWRRWAIPSAARSAMPWAGCRTRGAALEGKTPHPHESHPDAGPDGRMRGRWNQRAHAWLHRMGPPALLLSWLPVVGDSAVRRGRWLRLSFCSAWPTWPSASSLRYVAMTAGLLWFFPGQL